MDRRRTAALLAVLSIPPPPGDDVFLEILVQTIAALAQMPPGSPLTVRHRLFGEINNVWEGKNVYGQFANHPYEFFQITGETPETMTEILNDLQPAFQRIRHNFIQTLSPINRVMLFMIWLRSYPCYMFLSLLFDISPASVGKVLDAMLPLFHETYLGTIEWPSEQEWTALRGNWPKLPDAVGAIDGTSHHIYRPNVEPQALYYSGHRRTHCIHTVIIIDNEKNLRYVRSGFLGHQNDAAIFNTFPQIGHQLALQFPQDCLLLGDKIFPNGYPLMTPYTVPQINRRPAHQQQRYRRLNTIISEYRVYVEHVIREIKMYKCIGSLWRHPRYKIRKTVDVCAAMAHRRKGVF